MARDVKISFIGRCGADPKIEYLTDGSVVAKVRVAANPSKYDRETDTWQPQGDVQWYTVRVWDKYAEEMANYFSSGSEIEVEGLLRVRTWKDDDGVEHTENEVYAAHVRSVPSYDTARPLRED